MNDDDTLHSPGDPSFMPPEGDLIAFPTGETYTLVNEILSGAGLAGPNLDKLAKTVAPDIAAKWKHWIENCDRNIWTKPQGFCYRTLIRKPGALPPPIKNQDPPRQQKFSITGLLTNQANLTEQVNPMTEETDS